MRGCVVYIVVPRAMSRRCAVVRSGWAILLKRAGAPDVSQSTLVCGANVRSSDVSVCDADGVCGGRTPLHPALTTV